MNRGSSVVALGRESVLFNLSTRGAVARLDEGPCQPGFGFDGTTLAWIEGRRACVRCSATGEVRFVLGEDVSLATFDATRQRIVTVSDGKCCRLWDAVSGWPVKTLEVSAGRVNQVMFSSDGSRLVIVCALASNEKTAVRVYDVASGQMVFEKQTDTDSPLRSWGKQFDSAGARALLRSKSGEATLWDVTNDKALREFEAKLTQVEEFTPDGRFVVVISKDRSVEIVDAASGGTVMVLRGHRNVSNVDAAGHAVCSPSGRWLATWIWDGTVRLWDLMSTATTTGLRYIDGDIEQILPKTPGKVGGVLLLIRGRSGSDDLVLVDLAREVIAAERVKALQRRNRRGWELSRDSRLLAFAVQGTRLHVVDTDSLETVRVLGPFVGEIDWYPFWDNERIVVISGRCEAAILEAPTGKCISYARPEGEAFTRILGLEPDRGLLYSLDDHDMLQVWDLSVARVIGRAGPASGVYRVLAAGRARLITEESKTARLWDLTTGAEVGKISGRLLDVDPETGRYITYDKKLAMISAIDGKERSFLDIPKLVFARLVRGTSRVLVLQDLAEEDVAQFTLWDLETCSRVSQLLRGQRDRYFVDQFDQAAIKVTLDARTWSWDGTTGEELLTMTEERPPEPAPVVEISGARKTVRARYLTILGTNQIAASLLEVVHDYDSISSLIQYAKQSMPRALMPKEREKYNVDPTPPRWYVEMEKWPYGMPAWAELVGGKQPEGRKNTDHYAARL
jgi:WD40 repeat protein